LRVGEDRGGAGGVEAKALRYRFLHIPARLTRGFRRRQLRMPATWRWVRDAVATFTNVLAIPMLT
jgi:hypothetical protein